LDLPGVVGKAGDGRGHGPAHRLVRERLEQGCRAHGVAHRLALGGSRVRRATAPGPSAAPAAGGCAGAPPRTAPPARPAGRAGGPRGCMAWRRERPVTAGRTAAPSCASPSARVRLAGRTRPLRGPSVAAATVVSVGTGSDRTICTGAVSLGGAWR